jgi:hypothetical protein
VVTVRSTIESAIKGAHPEVTRVFVEAQSFAADRRGGPAPPDDRGEAEAAGPRPVVP